MTKEEYRDALEQLGVSVGYEPKFERRAADPTNSSYGWRRSVSEVLGISVRQSIRYATGETEIPEKIAKLIDLLLKQKDDRLSPKEKELLSVLHRI
jgi:hypothetical protein